MKKSILKIYITAIVIFLPCVSLGITMSVHNIVVSNSSSVSKTSNESYARTVQSYSNTHSNASTSKYDNAFSKVKIVVNGEVVEDIDTRLSDQQKNIDYEKEFTANNGTFNVNTKIQIADHNTDHDDAVASTNYAVTVRVNQANQDRQNMLSKLFVSMAQSFKSFIELNWFKN